MTYKLRLFSLICIWAPSMYVLDMSRKIKTSYRKYACGAFDRLQWLTRPQLLNKATNKDSEQGYTRACSDQINPEMSVWFCEKKPKTFSGNGNSLYDPRSDDTVIAAHRRRPNRSSEDGAADDGQQGPEDHEEQQSGESGQ